MDHQKLNILLIFGTFYFGGCGGQGCYFWPNPRVISKKSAIQNSQITFKPKLACIFLPARAKWNITVCVGTPCTHKGLILVLYVLLYIPPKRKQLKVKKIHCLICSIVSGTHMWNCLQISPKIIQFKVFATFA